MVQQPSITIWPWMRSLKGGGDRRFGGAGCFSYNTVHSSAADAPSLYATAPPLDSTGTKTTKNRPAPCWSLCHPPKSSASRGSGGPCLIENATAPAGWQWPPHPPSQTTPHFAFRVLLGTPADEGPLRVFRVAAWDLVLMDATPSPPCP